MHALRRLAAVALVLQLSGAASLISRASADEHHCQCSLMGKAGSRQCSCPICKLAALRAKANDASLPPCHRAAALQALEQELARPENGGAPCLGSDCGESRRYLGGNTSSEPFLLPRTPILRYVPTLERRRESPRAPAWIEPAPELPPPRAQLA